MGFLDRLRHMLAGPPRVQGDAADSVALQEEYGTSDEGAADLRRMETTAGGAVVPGIAGSDAAEAAEAEVESTEAPPESP